MDKRSYRKEVLADHKGSASSQSSCKCSGLWKEGQGSDSGRVKEFPCLVSYEFKI